MSKRKVTEASTDKVTDFSFYLLAGGLALAFLLVIVFVFINI